MKWCGDLGLKTGVRPTKTMPENHRSHALEMLVRNLTMFRTGRVFNGIGLSSLTS